MNSSEFGCGSKVADAYKRARIVPMTETAQPQFEPLPVKLDKKDRQIELLQNALWSACGFLAETHNSDTQFEYDSYMAGPPRKYGEPFMEAP